MGSQRAISGADQAQDLQHFVNDLARNETAQIELNVFGVSHREHRDARLDARQNVGVFG